MAFTKRSPERDDKRFKVIRESIVLANYVFSQDSKTKPWLKPEGRNLIEIARKEVPYSQKTTPRIFLDGCVEHGK